MGDSADSALKGTMPGRGLDEGSSTPVDLPATGWVATSWLADYSFTDYACAALVFFSVSQLVADRISVFTPTLALLVATFPVGIALLVRDALDGHWPSRWAAAFAGSGLVSVFLSPAWYPSLVGVVQRHNSWLVFVGGLAAYAIGRRVSANGVRLVARALIATILLSGLIAVLELVAGTSSGPYALYYGRPRGLSAHPVYLAQFAAASFGLGAWRVLKRADKLGYAAAALSAFVVGLAASRMAMVTVVLLVVWVMVVRARSSRLLEWRLPTTVAAAVITSWLLHRLADPTSTSSDAAPGASSVIGRGASSGVQDRLDVWGFGLRGWTERPVFGWGPGRFSMAAQGYYDADFVARFLRSTWGDAHNIGVELLTSWGVVGLIAFSGFAVAALRSGRGPFLVAALAAAASWLLQPVSPEGAVVVGVALGAAAVQRETAWRKPGPRALASALVLVGVLGGGLVLVGGDKDRLLDDPESASPPTGVSIWYHNDWTLAAVLAGPAVDTDEGLRAKRYWAERALKFEPDHAGSYVSLASAALLLGDIEAARVAAERATELQPAEFRAWVILRQVAIADRDEDTAADFAQQLCEVGAVQYCGDLDVGVVPEPPDE